MHRISVFLLIILLISGPVKLYSQETWTLEKCIEYAMENNIQVKQSRLNTEYNANLLKQSKLGQIPSLNAQGNYTYSWGRALDQTTYSFTNDQKINSISLNANSSVTLFNGFQTLNTIRQNELNLMAAYEDVDKIRNDISLNIAAAYLQILFNHELLQVAENQLGITRQQVDRTNQLVEAGKEAKGALLEIQAQYASEELTKVSAENQLALSYLNLQQLLDLHYDPGFKIAFPDLPVPGDSLLMLNVDEVYELAQTLMPQIKGAELNLQSAEKGYDIARGYRSPRLSASASLSSGYSDVRQQVTGETTSPQIPIGETAGGEPVYSYPQTVPVYGSYPFFEQLNDNMSTGVGVSLAIPIFNGWQANTAIANAKINVENYRLELQNKKNVLYREIQQSYADALAALKKFTATEQALTAMEESFMYMQKKYEVGLVNTVDYNTAKNQLAKTQSDLLQAKFDFIFKTKILNFYKGEPLTL